MSKTEQQDDKAKSAEKKPEAKPAQGVPHSDGTRFSDGTGYARVKTAAGVNANGK